ncbi:MAG TPA: hypothetical protein PK014_00400 [Thermoanaerobaculia bacterium]|nr:hypothetical protein [Thermoanaerobaculia bacterium]HXK66932.1 hypothetical protein [Thermoanaerobaculia bacterium]
MRWVLPRGWIEFDQRVVIIFIWTILVHSLFLLGNIDLHAPFSAFLYGDNPVYLAQAQGLLGGMPFDAGLPFHPPFTAWICLPALILFQGGKAFIASKFIMVLLNAGTMAGLYRLLHKIPMTFLIFLLLPLNFGELILSSAVSSEVPYRFLLVILFLLGGRLPIIGGVLHGLALQCRAEHILPVVLLLLLGFSRKSWSRFTLVSLIGFLLPTLPMTMLNAGKIRAYNHEHASTMAEPLPEIVPASLYGPVNFALAQSSRDIYFSREVLPPDTMGGESLDPRQPVHNRYMIHGYRAGLNAIFEHPGQAFIKALRKGIYSLQAFSYGWTWRDLPGKGEWPRQPVDMVQSNHLIFTLLSLLMTAVGVRSLRKERYLLGWIFALVAYRLVVNMAFFPYLRGMMIAAPAVYYLQLQGWSSLFGRWKTKILTFILFLLASFHIMTAPLKREYAVRGVVDEKGAIIHDEYLEVIFSGYVKDQ